MAATKISNIIKPEVFNPYVVEKTADLTAVMFGGIISTDSQLNALAKAGGSLIQMPFWSDLTGSDEVLSDGAALTPANITASKDIAALLMRGKAWGVNDLAKALSGDDPMGQVADLVAGFWARSQQATLINVLKGVFADNAANNGGDMTVSVASESIAGQSASTKIGADALVAASQTMGDAGRKLSAIAVHSKVFGDMQKQGVIAYLKPDQNNILEVPTFYGMRVIVDDGLPVVAGGTDGFKYTSYLFGEGAIGFGEGAAPVPTETDRDALAGEEYLITRRHYVLHPRGVKFDGSAAGASPTNAELATAGNWTRVYGRKNVRLASLITN